MEITYVNIYQNDHHTSVSLWTTDGGGDVQLGYDIIKMDQLLWLSGKNSPVPRQITYNLMFKPGFRLVAGVWTTSNWDKAQLNDHQFLFAYFKIRMKAEIKIKFVSIK